MLIAEHLSIQLGTKSIVQDVSFSLNEGEWMMVAGPNGAGKSTLVRALAQSLPYSGTLTLNGKTLASLKSKERARQLGILMQHNHVEFSFTVEEVVRLGRYAYTSGPLHKATQDDDVFVEDALHKTGLLPLKHRSVLTLSGGELQRCFLAQIFAQNPQVLVLDEPANHLDLIYQKQIFDLIQLWVKHPNRAVLSVVHDLSLAKCYGSHALLLNEGKTVAVGPVNEVLTNTHLNDVYHMDIAAWMQHLLCNWGA